MPRKRSTRKGSQKVRRSNASHGKPKARILKRGISGGSSNPPTDLVYRSNLLDQSFKPISAFILGGRNLEGRSATRELCVELYKCLLKAPGFVDDKEWTEFPTVSELAEYLFSKLLTIIPKGYDWHFLRHYHNSTYCIKYFKCRSDLYEGGICMPLEWTEQKKDHKLYDCIMYISYGVGRVCGLDIIYSGINDGFIHDLESCLSGYPEEDENMKKDAKKYRKGGEANVFHEAAKKLFIKEDPIKIYLKVNRFVPKTAFDKHLKRWLLNGIELLKKPVQVWDFCYPYNDPDMDSGEPLMVNSMVCFEWSLYDYCFNHSDQWKESIANEIGHAEPVEHGYITAKENVTPTNADSLKELYKFFKLGYGMYNKFFDNKLNKQYDRRASDLTV